MKRTFIIGIIVILVIVGLLAYLYIRQKSSREAFQSSQKPEPPENLYMCTIIKATREQCVTLLKKAEDEGKGDDAIAKAKLAVEIVDEELSKMRC